tara:strand:- start:159 stop:1178 length:1020 start_codon:yes stop_codon:yes gene_type:complete
MAQANTYQQPRIYIDNEEVLSDIKGSVTFTGNNQVNKLRVKITSPDMQMDALLHKKIQFFLNNGSIDSVPFFTGIITNVVPSDKQIDIDASDPRFLITGRDGFVATLTDVNNYDGYSIAGFLHSFITDKVNVDKTYIGLDMLSDTNPIKSFSGQRGTRAAYGWALRLIQDVIDDDDTLEPLTFFFDMIEDYKAPQLVIKKQKSLDSIPSMTFSYSDGLISYKYTRRTPANTAVYPDGTFVYSSRPTGNSVIKSRSTEDRAKDRELAIRDILISQNSPDEITIKTSKGYELGLGSIVRLNVTEDDISGNHRVVSKTITFGSGMGCTLKLNKEPIKVSDYI